MVDVLFGVTRNEKVIEELKLFSKKDTVKIWEKDPLYFFTVVGDRIKTIQKVLFNDHNTTSNIIQMNFASDLYKSLDKLCEKSPN